MPSWQIARDADRVELAGDLRLADARAIWRSLHEVALAPRPAAEINLARIARIDGAVMSLVVEARALARARGAACELVGAPPDIAPIVHLYGGDAATLPPRLRPHVSPVGRVGTATVRMAQWLGHIASFTGELMVALGGVFRHPRSANWRALPMLVERAGADGMPIVVLLNFLVGFVGAFQAMVPLRQVGANIYVADLIGVSVTRELAPLITAIIIAGRSGAAFAAEIGTMRVSEEIDALRTMGIAPQPYLVIPRVVALALVTPLLTLLGDVTGVFGGVVVGVSSLGVTANGFLAELRTIVTVSDVWTGLVKSAAFGIAIALIGCQQGLSARGAAAGVGRSTTSTVVISLFSIVALDTLFTTLFRALGV